MDLKKTEVLQTGKMRKDFFEWCKHQTPPQCDQAHAAMFNRLYQGFDQDYAGYEAYGQEYLGYGFDDDAEYEMYEEAMGNLNRAQMEYDLALKLLQRTQQERLRRDRASRYYD